MRVKTLNNSKLSEHCSRLEQRVLVDGAPELVVGIANGGAKVAELMFTDVPHVYVSARRPSSSSKDKAGPVMKLIRRLPLWMKDGLRKIESRILSFRHPVAPSVNITFSLVKIPTDILIVDDAVDSGATMLAVSEAVRKIAPESRLRSAAITVTTAYPVFRPQYTIYNNKTLLRFPWSKDYKEEK